MRTVRDKSGRTYVLVKRSGEEWLVRDPETGRETYRPVAEFDVVDDEPPLAVAANAVTQPIRTVLTAVRTERALGLLVELDRDGPLSVRTLLDRYEYCESDLHGQLAEFRAADLIEERRVAGERGYVTTDDAGEAITMLTVDQFQAT